MRVEHMRSMVERHAELEDQRKELMRQTAKFQYEVKKALLEEGLVDALSINWSMLRRMSR